LKDGDIAKGVIDCFPISGIRPGSIWVLAILDFSPSPKFEIAETILNVGEQNISKKAKLR